MTKRRRALSLTRRCLAYVGMLPVEFRSALASTADASGRIAHDDRVVWNVPGHNRPEPTRANRPTVTPGRIYVLADLDPEIDV